MLRSATVRRKPTAAPPRTVPLDDEPVATVDIRAAVAARTAVARGDSGTLAETKTHVAVSRGRTGTRQPEVR